MWTGQDLVDSQGCSNRINSRKPAKSSFLVLGHISQQWKTFKAKCTTIPGRFSDYVEKEFWPARDDFLSKFPNYETSMRIGRLIMKGRVRKVIFRCFMRSMAIRLTIRILRC